MKKQPKPSEAACKKRRKRYPTLSFRPSKQHECGLRFLQSKTKKPISYFLGIGIAHVLRKYGHVLRKHGVRAATQTSDSLLK